MNVGRGKTMKPYMRIGLHRSRLVWKIFDITWDDDGNDVEHFLTTQAWWDVWVAWKITRFLRLEHEKAQGQR